MKKIVIFFLLLGALVLVFVIVKKPNNFGCFSWQTPYEIEREIICVGTFGKSFEDLCEEVCQGKPCLILEKWPPGIACH